MEKRRTQKGNGVLVVILVLLVLTIVGLSAAIVLNLNKSGSNSESLLAQKSCMQEPSANEVAGCIIGVYETSGNMDDAINIYTDAISQARSNNDLELAAELIASRTSFLGGMGFCQQAFTLFDNEDLGNFNNRLLVKMYSQAAETGETCGLEEQRAIYNDLLNKAREGVGDDVLIY